MIEILTDRKKQLETQYRNNPDVEILIRMREVDLLRKRVKRRLDAEIDAAGFRNDLANIVTELSFINPFPTALNTKTGKPLQVNPDNYEESPL
jgi:hypothetical protein